MRSINPFKYISPRTIVLVLLVSVVLGGFLTSYIGGFQQRQLMPIRNLIVLGEWEQHSFEEIGESRYAHGAGINPVHIALSVRDTALNILDNPQEAPATLSDSDRERLIEVADFFVASGQEETYEDLAYVVWTYDFDYPYYGLESSWLSGMAQGYVIEVLLAAHLLTADDQYLTTARLGGNTLAVPIDNGGVAIAVGDDALWFEEYAQAGVTPPRVLNGHNFALEGLWYLCQLDVEYCQLHQQGVNGLQILLPQFDARLWSRYDLDRKLADWKYQHVHVNQLNDLAAITGDQLFADYARAFRRQELVPFGAFYRIAVDPGEFIIGLLLLNSAVIFVLIVPAIYYRNRRKDRSSKHASQEATAEAIS